MLGLNLLHATLNSLMEMVPSPFESNCLNTFLSLSRWKGVSVFILLSTDENQVSIIMKLKKDFIVPLSDT